MHPVIIIKTGGTFPELSHTMGDFEDWTRQGMGLDEHEVRTIDVAAGQPLPPPQECTAAVITGSHAMVTEEGDWMRATAVWLQDAVASHLPILGICFGHQLLAAALGGRAGWNPFGREIGTVEIRLTDEGCADPLFGQLPVTFPAQVTHRQSALTLPPSACLLAKSPGDPHQAFRVGSAWGVQFHPEFSLAAMQHYIRVLRSELTHENLDPAGLLAALTPTQAAHSVLARFIALVRSSNIPW